MQIHLLKGYEYSFNPETDTTDLIEPIIEKGFSKDSHATSFIKAIAKEWGRYLENREID